MEKILCPTIHVYRQHDCSYVDVGTVYYTVFDVCLYLLLARVPLQRLLSQFFYPIPVIWACHKDGRWGKVDKYAERWDQETNAI